jgi:tripartite ATP-independent transporter DctP family solute receptor
MNNTWAGCAPEGEYPAFPLAPRGNLKKIPIDMKINNALVAGLLLAFLFSACSKQQDVKVIKLAHGLSQQHSVHKAMEFMAQRVREKSGGKLDIEIYHSSQLGSEAQCLELLQIGSLGITKVSSGVMESFAPGFKALGLPYMFRDKEHLFKVVDGEIGKELLVQGEKAFLRGLCFYDAGSRSFYTKKRPINSPDDLKGMKIRVMASITSSKMVDALGGAPMPISWGELYTALQQGVVDGAENNPPSFYLSRHYEVCKYYTLNEHTFLPDVLLISTIIWDRLTPEEQRWLQEAAEESVPVQHKYWDESEAESLAAVEAAGVEVYRLSPEEKAAFAQKVEDIAHLFKNDKAVYDMIQRIKQVQ